MNDEIWLDIKTYLALEKTMSEQERDRYLRDYHLAFRGASDNWSVPERDYKEYLALEHQKKQAKEGLVVGNVDIVVDESGLLLIRQGSNVVQVPAENRLAFQSALFKLPSRGGHPGTVPGQTIAGGQSSAPTNIGNNHLENDDRPGMKERMERALKEMEKIGQQAYPKTR